MLVYSPKYGIVYIDLSIKNEDYCSPRIGVLENDLHIMMFSCDVIKILFTVKYLHRCHLK